MANLYWPRHVLRSRKRRARRRRAGWAQAAREAPEVLVLSHGQCLDGITSAVVAQRTLQGVAVAYAQPSQVSHALQVFSKVPGAGRRLIVADLSLQPADLGAIVAACRRLREGGWTIEWLDHHHKQWEGLDLTRLEAQIETLTIDRNQKESGATLVQKRLAPRDRFLKRLAETVRDRDLWWNKTPDSETLEFALTDMGADDFARHLRAHDGEGPVVDDTLAAAAHREQGRQEREAGRVLAGTRRYGAPPARVAVVYGWLPRNTGLHTLLEGDCAVAANIRPNGKMSIRSRQGFEVCHTVAQRFGGGGHPNASGADLGVTGPRYWWYVLSRGRRMADDVGQACLDVLAEAGLVDEGADGGTADDRSTSGRHAPGTG